MQTKEEEELTGVPDSLLGILTRVDNNVTPIWQSYQLIKHDFPWLSVKKEAFFRLLSEKLPTEDPEIQTSNGLDVDIIWDHTTLSLTPVDSLCMNINGTYKFHYFENCLEYVSFVIGALVINSDYKIKVVEDKQPELIVYNDDNGRLSVSDDIWQIVSSLSDNLSRNTLSSNLNIFVQDYFATVDFIVEEEEDEEKRGKYDSLVREIEITLKIHDWVCKSETSAGGFHTQPDRLSLSRDIKEIIGRHF